MSLGASQVTETKTTYDYDMGWESREAITPILAVGHLRRGWPRVVASLDGVRTDTLRRLGWPRVVAT